MSICGIMIGIITARAPQLFNISVVHKVHKHYIWDHFHCWETFVWKFLQEYMNWSLCHSTCPGKKILDGVTYIITNAFFCWPTCNSGHDPIPASSTSWSAAPHIYHTLPLTHCDQPQTTLSPHTQLTLHTILLTLAICLRAPIKGSRSPPLLFAEASHTHCEHPHCYVSTSFPIIRNTSLWPPTFATFPSTHPSPSYSGP